MAFKQNRDAFRGRKGWHTFIRFPQLKAPLEHAMDFLRHIHIAFQSSYHLALHPITKPITVSIQREKDMLKSKQKHDISSEI